MRQTERVKGDQLPYRANKPSGVVAREAAAAQGLRHAFGHHALRTASQKISRSVRPHAQHTAASEPPSAYTGANPSTDEEDREATWYTVQAANRRAGFAREGQ